MDGSHGTCGWCNNEVLCQEMMGEVLAVTLSLLFTPWKWLSFNSRGGACGPWLDGLEAVWEVSPSPAVAASCEADSPGGDTVVPESLAHRGSPGDCTGSAPCSSRAWAVALPERTRGGDSDFQILVSNFSCHGNKIPFLLHAVTFPQRCSLISNRLCLSSPLFLSAIFMAQASRII